MKTMKKMLLICLVASFAVAAFGCSDKDDDLQMETISIDQTKTDLTFYYNQGSAEDATEADPTDASETTSGDDAPEVYEEVTEIVEVTDADGQTVTEADGSVQTDIVVVETRPITPTEGEQKPVTNYTPAYDTCKAYWMDMSQLGDYTFNGEFLVITFQVKDDVPDGNYPVSISMTDIASWDLVKYEPVKINGEVAVNSEPAAQEDPSGSDFTLKVNSTTAKPGELATVVVDLSNNPGFCGFVIDIQYDANALKIINASGGGDFDKAVNLT